MASPVAGLKPVWRHLLTQTRTFAVCSELVTSRGIITERSGRRVLELARLLAQDPRVHALSITDNPGGNAMLSADTLGTDLLARGQEVIIHLSCKDWNRNALQSHAWKLASEGFDNVLALSGDFPTGGYHGQASGVFDLDSVGLLRLFADLNAGLPQAAGGRGMARTRFFPGAVVSNFKRHEREVMPQYFKLAKKIENGASFIITQVGYDARKQDELLKYMALRGLETPVLANVYVLSPAAARYFHAGQIPGVVVTDELLALAERQGASPDRGRAFFLEFAARQCAVARGLGYRGVYLGGHLRYEDYDRLLELVAAFGEEDWRRFAGELRYSQPGEFYFFEADPDTGLSSTAVNREYLRSKSAAGQAGLPLGYRLHKLVHDRVFEPGTAGFAAGRRLYRAVEGAGEGVRRALHGVEQALKIAAFDCRDCGDCSLPEIAFLCPESQCAKNQRNGPCGGTRQGRCEVGEKECIWALAYQRLKAQGKEEQMLERPVVFKDGALQGTSAWANAFLGRDHRGQSAKGSG
jgi:methylenetetrahydrofolate reductase (NADPH)